MRADCREKTYLSARAHAKGLSRRDHQNRDCPSPKPSKTNIKDYRVPDYARDYQKCKQTAQVAMLKPFEEK
jgi:hypothetical protein